MEDFATVVARALAGATAGARTGIGEACDELLRESRDQVPYDTGALSQSGQSKVTGAGNKVTGTVSFDTPYAAIQHEDTAYAHDRGNAHYLGDPLRDNADRLLQHVAKAIGEGFTRGG